MASTTLSEVGATVGGTGVVLDLASPGLETRRGGTGGAARTQSVQGADQTTRTSIGLTTNGLDVQHFAPDIASAGLAEIDLDLNRGFQGLNVMEDHREGDQASRDGNGAEDDGREGDATRGGRLVAHLA
jgi:hypothetical protein